MLPDRVREGGDFGGVEMATRLEGVGVDLVDGDEGEVGAIEGDGVVAPLFSTEEGFEAAAEASLIHVR